MNPISIHPIIFYLFVFVAFLMTVYAIMISWIYFSRWFKDAFLFIDAQNRWEIIYANPKNADEMEHNGSEYMLKAENFKPPLNKSGKALYKFSADNPQPESLSHTPAKEVSGKTIMAIVNNKLVQILMSLQSTFMNLQYIMLICSIISAIASALVALKIFGIIK